MGLREKIAERAQPYLEPGEKVLVAFPAQAGMSPWMTTAVGGLVMLLLVKPRIVVVTDRGIVVLSASKLVGGRPKEFVARGPYTYLGEPSGLWYKFPLGERTYVHRRFHKDVRRANELMGVTP